jgi:2-methylcitrate dehydratase PrpD
LLDDVVAHARGVRVADLPSDVLRAAEALLLDTLGVGQAGRTTAESAMALDTVRGWGAGDEVAVWAGGPTLPTAHAAFVNAHQVHTLEFDAIHEGAVVHPLTVVVPTVLAFAAREQRAGRTFSGDDLLAAVVVGVDVAAGLGRASRSAIRFFRPAVCGAMGAVAALVSLDRTDPAVARSAFGIAYGAVSGTMQPHTEGAQVLALQCGLAARSALNAHDLARTGFVGPEFVLEGRYGWFTLIESDGDPAAFVGDLGRVWEIAATSVKPFPSGRATHGGLDMMLALQAEHGFGADDVVDAVIEVPSLVFDLVGRPAALGMPVGAARLCLPYLVPIALADGTVDLRAYADDRLHDPALFARAERVRVMRSDNPDPNAFNPQRAEVRLRDGRVLHAVRDHVLGSPEHPVTPERLRAKFDANLAAAGRSEVAPALAALLDDLRSLDDLRPLLELL